MYAWQMTVQNNGNSAASLTAKIKWIDADGFVIKSTWATIGVSLPASQKKRFSGAELISMPGAIMSRESKWSYRGLSVSGSS